MIGDDDDLATQLSLPITLDPEVKAEEALTCPQGLYHILS